MTAVRVWGIGLFNNWESLQIEPVPCSTITTFSFSICSSHWCKWGKVKGNCLTRVFARLLSASGGFGSSSVFLVYNKSLSSGRYRNLSIRNCQHSTIPPEEKRCYAFTYIQQLGCIGSRTGWLLWSQNQKRSNPSRCRQFRLQHTSPCMSSRKQSQNSKFFSWWPPMYGRVYDWAGFVYFHSNLLSHGFTDYIFISSGNETNFAFLMNWLLTPFRMKLSHPSRWWAKAAIERSWLYWEVESWPTCSLLNA